MLHFYTASASRPPQHSKLGLLSAILLTALIFLGTNTVQACTTVIVGREASDDGSRIFGRTEDAPPEIVVKRFIPTQAVTNDKPVAFVDRVNKLTLDLPANGCSYLAFPDIVPPPHSDRYDEAAINAHQVCLSATESIFANENALKADPLVPTGVREANIPKIVIPYVATAIEGIERLGQLVDKYGAAEGNAVVFADTKEMWYMEMYTGHQWAAIRLPENRCAVIANAGMLGTIDLTDTSNVRYSKNLVKLAQEQHFLQEENGKIHLSKTYCPAPQDFNQIRIWAGQRKFAPSQAKAYDQSATYEMLIKPDKKIALADVMELFRYRYEDTEYNVNLHPQNHAIGINRTAGAHLFWLRDNKPVIMWVALANPEMSVFLPMYSNVTELPPAFSLDTTEYTRDSAYFKFRSLSAVAAHDRLGYGKAVRDYWHQLELSLIDNIPAMDKEYALAGYSSEKANMLCGNIGQAALDSADELFQQAFTAFMLASIQEDERKDAPSDSTATK